jgi:hypothetical protein
MRDTTDTIIDLRNENKRLRRELAELNAAFTSLSGLVMEQDQDKWAAWTQTHPAAELARKEEPER